MFFKVSWRLRGILSVWEYCGQEFGTVFFLDSIFYVVLVLIISEIIIISIISSQRVPCKSSLFLR